MTIGIVGAMEEEIASLKRDMRMLDQPPDSLGGRLYYRGSLYGREVICTHSRWGKVASASTVATLLDRYHVKAVVFVGVAGGVAPGVNIGDVVVATELVQYDVDGRPIFPQFEIPLLGISRFPTDPHLRKAAVRATRAFVGRDLTSEIHAEALASFRILQPSVIQGPVASGDQFVANRRKLARLLNGLSGVKCIEMEGAAVAQVCYEHDTPFVVIRAVSDKAGGGADFDFRRFVGEVASRYSRGIVRRLMPLL